jgi:hypothetical protein
MMNDDRAWLWFFCHNVPNTVFRSETRFWWNSIFSTLKVKQLHSFKLPGITHICRTIDICIGHLIIFWRSYGSCTHQAWQYQLFWRQCVFHNQQFPFSLYSHKYAKKKMSKFVNAIDMKFIQLTYRTVPNKPLRLFIWHTHFFEKMGT